MVVAFPSASALLRDVAETPGSAIVFVSVEKLLQKYRRQRGKDPVAWQHMRIWATTGEIKAIPKAQKAYRPVYAHWEDCLTCSGPRRRRIARVSEAAVTASEMGAGRVSHRGIRQLCKQRSFVIGKRLRQPAQSRTLSSLAKNKTYHFVQ